MKLVLNNVTYYNYPVQVREKVAFTADDELSTEQIQAADSINKMFLSQDEHD